MINQELKLKLQAHLDHELSERESRQMADLVGRDPDAGSLYAQLAESARLIRGNELEVKCPETREFYWSQIERAIRQNSRQEPAGGWRAHSWSWWRVVAPAMGVALLLMVGLFMLRPTTGSGRLSYLNEIDTPLEETSAISFHSQATGVTVVWVTSRGAYGE